MRSIITDCEPGHRTDGPHPKARGNSENRIGAQKTLDPRPRRPSYVRGKASEFSKLDPSTVGPSSIRGLRALPTCINRWHPTSNQGRAPYAFVGSSRGNIEAHSVGTLLPAYQSSCCRRNFVALLVFSCQHASGKITRRSEKERHPCCTGL